MAVRVGLVGCGWMAPFQLAGWRMIPGVELAGVSDRNPDRARDVAARWGIAWAGDDLVRMLEECRVQVLDIATTPESHKELALTALNRGIHVVCQKPAAPSIEEAEAMILGAEQRGLTLYINEMQRFCPWYVKIKELLDQGRIGRPGYARIFCRTAAFMEVGPDRRVMYGSRDFLRSQDRLIMLEETIHYLDVARYLFGDPHSVYAVTGRLSSLVRGEDMAAVILRYEGLTVLVEDSWSAHGPARSGMEIEGARGAILLSHPKVLELHSGRTGALEERWDFKNPSWDEIRPELFAAVFRDFLRVVHGGREQTTQAQDNLKTLRLVMTAYESAASGAALTL